MKKTIKSFLTLTLISPLSLTVACKNPTDYNGTGYGLNRYFLDVTKKFIKTNIFESKEDFDNKYNKLKNKFETENSLTIYNKYDFEQVVEEQDFYFEIIFSDSFEEIDLLEVQIKTLEPIEGVMANGRMITDEDKVKFDIANQGLTVKTNNLVLNNDGNTIDLEIKNFDNWNNLNFDFYSFESGEEKIYSSSSKDMPREIPGYFKFIKTKDSQKAYITGLNNGFPPSYNKLLIWEETEYGFNWSKIKLSQNNTANEVMNIQLTDPTGSGGAQCNDEMTICHNTQGAVKFDIYIKNLVPEIAKNYEFSVAHYNKELDIFSYNNDISTTSEVVDDHLRIWMHQEIPIGKIIIAPNFDLNVKPWELKFVST